MASLKIDLDNVAISVKGKMEFQEIINEGGLADVGSSQARWNIKGLGDSAHGGAAGKLTDNVSATTDQKHKGLEGGGTRINLTAAATTVDNDTGSAIIDWNVAVAEFSTGKVKCTLSGTASANSQLIVQLLKGTEVLYLLSVTGNGKIEVEFPIQVTA